MELMVTLTVAGILLSLAIPSYRTFVLNAQRTQTANDLLMAMQIARSESQKAGRVTTVCPIAAPNTCGPNWSLGWMVFVNVDGDGVFDPEDRLLLTFQRDATNTIRSSAFPTNNRYHFAPFNRTSTNGTLTICDSRGAAEARAVIVSPSGRTRTSSVSDSGAALTCS